MNKKDAHRLVRFILFIPAMIVFICTLTVGISVMTSTTGIITFDPRPGFWYGLLTVFSACYILISWVIYATKK
jgi:hypothetical protein